MLLLQTVLVLFSWPGILLPEVKFDFMCGMHTNGCHEKFWQKINAGDKNGYETDLQVGKLSPRPPQ